MPVIQGGLEKLLGNQGFVKLRDSKFLRFKPYDSGVDAFCLNTYSLYLTLFFEKFLAGMNWKRYLLTRSVAFFTNTPTARPYEKIRSYVFNKLSITDDTPVKKYAADTVLFIGLQMPLHWANMALGTLLENGKIEKEDLVTMAVASFSMIPIAGLVGGPYGLYRDAIRESSGLESEHPKKPHYSKT